MGSKEEKAILDFINYKKNRCSNVKEIIFNLFGLLRWSVVTSNNRDSPLIRPSLEKIISHRIYPVETMSLTQTAVLTVAFVLRLKPQEEGE